MCQHEPPAAYTYIYSSGRILESNIGNEVARERSEEEKIQAVLFKLSVFRATERWRNQTNKT